MAGGLLLAALLATAEAMVGSRPAAMAARKAAESAVAFSTLSASPSLEALQHQLACYAHQFGADNQCGAANGRGGGFPWMDSASAARNDAFSCGFVEIDGVAASRHQWSQMVCGAHQCGADNQCGAAHGWGGAVSRLDLLDSGANDAFSSGLVEFCEAAAARRSWSQVQHSSWAAAGNGANQAAASATGGDFSVEAATSSMQQTCDAITGRAEQIHISRDASSGVRPTREGHLKVYAAVVTLLLLLMGACLGARQVAFQQRQGRDQARAAVQIQAATRGYLGRFISVKTVAEYWNAAVHIQS